MADTPNIATITPEDSGSALDELFKQTTGAPPEPKDDDVVDPPTPPEPKDDDDKVDPPEPKDDDDKVDPPTPPEPKDDPAPPAPEPPKDNLDEVELPPYTKPNTRDQFAEVKKRARDTIAAKEAEIEKLRKEREEFEQKASAALPPESAKELEELRNFRRSVDIENDPGFKSQFEGKIEANNDSILTKLKEVGMSDAQIDQIKKLGGPDQVDWDSISGKIPAQLKRFIDAKLVQNQDLRDERAAAVEKARKDPNVFEKQRQETQAATLTKSANEYMSQFAWTAVKPVPSNATPEQKAKIEADNALATEAQKTVQAALKDYSPEVFAELAVGTAAAIKFKKDVEVLTAKAKETSDNLAKITKERDDLKAELEKIKKAGRTHRDSTTTVPPAPANPFATSGQDALDKLKSQIA